VEEEEKLLQTRFIEEVYYPNWLANVLMVKKSKRKWTSTRRVQKIYIFPLPQIDLLVDSTPGHELLSFMDAFSG